MAVRIARNLAIDELRRRRPKVVGDERLLATLADPVAREAVGDPLLREHIVKCRELLPRKPGLALTARLEASGGRPDEDLAQQLGMNVNAFLQNFTRARRFLAECLRRAGVEL